MIYRQFKNETHQPQELTEKGSSPQLAQVSIQQLHRQILRFQVANLQRRDLCPDIAVMLAWIEQAKILTRELK